MSIGLFKNRYEAAPSLLVYSKYRAVDDLSLCSHASRYSWASASAPALQLDSSAAVETIRVDVVGQAPTTAT